MKLYEFEGHGLLAKAGIDSPFFIVCKNLAEIKAARNKFKFPLVAKVQVLSGKRGKSGGVAVIKRQAQLEEFANTYFGKEFNSEEVRFIILAQKADFEHEYYISINYDTVSRLPYVMFCEKGGIEIEESIATGVDILRADIDPFIGPEKSQFKKWPVDFEFVTKLWKVFSDFDARLVEINPLVKTSSNQFVALDCKIILDDNGLSRQKEIEILPKGAISAVPTKREIEAKKIDESDYRGSAGSAFVEMDGDIAIMASGGGASLLVMDSLIAAGGRPANYTEYSGNPSREKVEKLTKVVLNRGGLSGCLVAGAVANFTDIYETLSGFAQALKGMKKKPMYPIVIRRGGPRQGEAYKMLASFAKKEGFDIHLFGPETPISVAAKEMVRLSNQFKTSSSKIKTKN